MNHIKKLNHISLPLLVLALGCGPKKATLPSSANVSDAQPTSTDGLAPNNVVDAAGDGGAAIKNNLKAETIIEKSLAAMGGEDAMLNIKTLEARDCGLEISPMGLKGKSTSIHQSPSSYKMIQELVGVGKTEAGYDGEVAWEMSSMTGARIVEGDEKLAVIESTDLTKDANWQKYYTSATSDGTARIGDKNALKVNFARKNGKDVTRYYDMETFYLLREEREDTTQMGVIKSEMNFEDYRKVGGVLMAHRIRVKAASATVLMTCANMVANKEIDPAEFAIPEEIKKLKK